MYTLAGVVNREMGWGRAEESWRVMAHVAELGGPAWFRLGDRDLGTHLVRTHLLDRGERLTEVTAFLRRQFGVAHTVLPMADRPVPTRVVTPQGTLGFQEWFVGEQWQPPALKIDLPDDARATADVVQALTAADIVIIGPSNPFVSIDPILNCYPVRPTITDEPSVVVAVSPIVGGDAVKGPTAKMMRERDLSVSPLTIAERYADLIDGFVYDERDAGAFGAEAGPLHCTDTLMTTLEARRRVAGEVLNFARSLLER
jgi:LPPG:FO 2-phospho-L-lactate transferase